MASPSQSAWLLRIVVWTALALTLAFAGPTAWSHVASRFDAGFAALASERALGPEVALDRVRLQAVPSWVDRANARGLLSRYEAIVGGRVLRLHDTEGARALRAALEAIPCVRQAAIERRYPDRFVARLSLRRPVLAVAVKAAAAGEGSSAAALAVVDEDGVALPVGFGVAADELPFVELWADGSGAALVDRIRPGEPFPRPPDRPGPRGSPRVGAPHGRHGRRTARPRRLELGLDLPSAAALQ